MNSNTLKASMMMMTTMMKEKVESDADLNCVGHGQSRHAGGQVLGHDGEEGCECSGQVA